MNPEIAKHFLTDTISSTLQSRWTYTQNQERKYFNLGDRAKWISFLLFGCFLPQISLPSGIIFRCGNECAPQLCHVLCLWCVQKMIHCWGRIEWSVIDPFILTMRNCILDIKKCNMLAMWKLVKIVNVSLRCATWKLSVIFSITF